MTSFASVEELTGALNRVDYLVDEGLATALYLAQSLGQPLLLEGEPGVGKTAAAKAMAKALNTPLLRLQCYEGIAANEALYEWNYPASASGHSVIRGRWSEAGRHRPVYR